MDVQKLKIYLVIENPETRDLVNINGSLEVFRELLDLFPEIYQADPTALAAPPVDRSPVVGEDPKRTERGTNVKP